MRWLALLVLPLLAVQEDARLDAILRRLNDNAGKAKTPEERRTVLKASLGELDEFLATAKDPKVGGGAANLAAQLARDLDDAKGAAARLEKVLERWPDHEQASEIRYAAAEYSWEAGDDAGARGHYHAIARGTKEDELAFRARCRAGQTLITEGKFDEAVTAFEQLRLDQKGKKGEWAAAMALAQALQFAEKLGPAREQIEQVVRSATELGTVEQAKHILANLLWIGKPAPAIEEKDLKGAAFSLSAAKGKVAVVHFLWSGFPMLEMEAEVIRRLRKAVPETELAVLGVSIDLDPAKTAQLAEGASIDWPLHHDGGGYDGKLAKAYAVREPLPLVVVIDRKGVIRFVNPLFSPHGRELQAAVRKLAAEK